MITRDANDQDVRVCDGCGRSDAGPGTVLHITEYDVRDPNLLTDVQHHYCPGCARNRKLTETLTTTIPGWNAVNPPTVGPGETPEEHEAAMRGESHSVNNGISVKFEPPVSGSPDAEASGAPAPPPEVESLGDEDEQVVIEGSTEE